MRTPPFAARVCYEYHQKLPALLCLVQGADHVLPAQLHLQGGTVASYLSNRLATAWLGWMVGWEGGGG